jgi:hypothetical protein
MSSHYTSITYNDKLVMCRHESTPYNVYYRLCNISSSMCQTFTFANSHEYMVTEAQDPLRPPMGVISNVVFIIYYWTRVWRFDLIVPKWRLVKEKQLGQLIHRSGRVFFSFLIRPFVQYQHITIVTHPVIRSSLSVMTCMFFISVILNYVHVQLIHGNFGPCPPWDFTIEAFDWSRPFQAVQFPLLINY